MFRGASNCWLLLRGTLMECGLTFRWSMTVVVMYVGCCWKARKSTVSPAAAKSGTVP